MALIVSRLWVCIGALTWFGPFCQGTIPWKGEEPRRSVLFGYYSRHNPRRPRL